MRTVSFKLESLVISSICGESPIAKRKHSNNSFCLIGLLRNQRLSNLSASEIHLSCPIGFSIIKEIFLSCGAFRMFEIFSVLLNSFYKKQSKLNTNHFGWFIKVDIYDEKTLISFSVSISGKSTNQHFARSALTCTFALTWFPQTQLTLTDVSINVIYAKSSVINLSFNT